MKRYPAKLLLFGEYTIVLGSKALAIPFRKYGGEWDFDNNKGIETQFSRLELSTFFQYLKTLAFAGIMKTSFDMDRFYSELQNGIYFKSDIPEGYGAGSSGAFVAAVYDRYFEVSEQSQQENSHLKKLFALMESHFHGESSGVDPLVSFLDKPILLESKGVVKIVDLPKSGSSEAGIFLINTGITRKTSPLVKHFLQSCQEESYLKAIRKELMPQNEEAIRSYLAGDLTKLLESVSQISALQYLHFSKMIPESFRDIWKEGIDSGLYSLKLCGAGGGGYILGFTSSFENLPETISEIVSDKLAYL